MSNLANWLVQVDWVSHGTIDDVWHRQRQTTARGEQNDYISLVMAWFWIVFFWFAKQTRSSWKIWKIRKRLEPVAGWNYGEAIWWSRAPTAFLTTSGTVLTALLRYAVVSSGRLLYMCSLVLMYSNVFYTLDWWYVVIIWMMSCRNQQGH